MIVKAVRGGKSQLDADIRVLPGYGRIGCGIQIVFLSLNLSGNLNAVLSLDCTVICNRFFPVFIGNLQIRMILQGGIDAFLYGSCFPLCIRYRRKRE